MTITSQRRPAAELPELPPPTTALPPPDRKLAISRLIWKEYRAQRKVWLALMLGTVTLQAASAPYALREQPGLPMLLAWVMCIGHVAFCAAALFAGEREEDTDRLLQGCPIAPSTLWIGKFAYALAATVLFCVILGSWTQLVFPHSLEAALRSSGMEYARVLNSVVPILCSGWLMLGLSLLASVWMNGVIRALVVGTVLFFAFTMPLTSLLDASVLAMVNVAGGCIALALSAALTGRWLRGVSGVRLPRFSGNSLVSTHWQHIRQQPLRRVATHRTALVRQAGVLLWQELLRLSTPATIIFGVLWLWFMYLIRISTPWGADAFTWIVFILLPANALSVGLLAFSYEQRTRTMAFYADRGISPTLVWLCKLSAGIVVVAAAIVPLLSSFEWMSGGRWRIQSYRNPSVTFGSVLPPAALIMTPFWIGLAFFSVGQWLSLWIRTVTLRAIAGLLTGVYLVGTTIALLLWLRISPLYSLAPLSILCLLATFTTMNAWVNQQRSWKLVARKAGWLLAVLIIPATGSAWNRVTSIPLVNEPIDWRQHAAKIENVDEQLTSRAEELVTWARSSRPADAERDGDNRYHELQHRVRDFVTALEANPSGRIRFSVIEMVPWLSLRSLTSQTRYSGSPPPRGLEEEWENLSNSVRLQTYLATQQAVRGLSYQYQWQGDTWRAIRTWAQRPDQNIESLRDAAEFLSRQKLDARQTLFNQYTVAMQVLRKEREPWSTGQRSKNPVWSDALLNFVRPIEDMRAERLVRLRFANLLALADHLDSEGVAPLPLTPEVLEAGSWDHATPALIGVPDMGFVTMNSTKVNLLELRVTQLLVELELWRTEHEEYPESLEALFSPRMPRLPTNPYLGSEFHYAPHGLPLPLYQHTRFTGGAEGNVHFYRPGRPLLWTYGPGKTSLKYATAGSEDYLMSSNTEPPTRRDDFDAETRIREARQASDRPIPEQNQQLLYLQIH